MADTKAVSLYLDDKVLAIRMPIELWRKLKNYCFDKNISMNIVIRGLIEERYNTNNEKEMRNAIWQEKINSDKSINSIVVGLLDNLLK